jgi:hypothetical protein
MIEDSKKSFYHGCAAQYTRLFTMVKLFQLKASNGWSDGSTLLDDVQIDTSAYVVVKVDIVHENM